MKTNISKKSLSELNYQLRKLEDTYIITTETLWGCMDKMKKNLDKKNLYETEVYARFMLMFCENFTYTVKSLRDYVDHTILETEVHNYQDSPEK